MKNFTKLEKGKQYFISYKGEYEYDGFSGIATFDGRFDEKEDLYEFSLSDLPTKENGWQTKAWFGIDDVSGEVKKSDSEIEIENMKLRAKLAGAEIEIDRLKAEVQAARMVLKKWLENIEELREATKYLSK